MASLQGNPHCCGASGGTAAETSSEYAAPPGLFIRLSTEQDASCEVTVERIVETVNAAYLFGEQGLWLDGVASRTNAEEIAELLRGGKLILLTEARSGGEVVGSVLADDAGGRCGELGMLNVAEAYRQTGAGRALIAAARGALQGFRLQAHQAAASSRRRTLCTLSKCGSSAGTRSLGMSSRGTGRTLAKSTRTYSRCCRAAAS